MPIAPLEAISSGLIVLGSRVPGVEDILEDFPECLFEAGNVEDLKNKISYFINLNEFDKDNLIKKMIKSVMTRYEMSRFIEGHEDLYKKITQ